MPRRAPSRITGLIKRHHGCQNHQDPTRCRCEWIGKYGRKEIVLSRWARCKIDPHDKAAAQPVLTRFFAAVDAKTFDPAGERPALGTAETLSSFITEWQTHYAEPQGLESTSLDAMLNVISTGTLGSHSLEHLAGSSQEIERWLNATGKIRKWSNKTWNEYRGLLFRVLKRATVWKVNGKPRLAVNPIAEIATRVTEQPEHFKQRHLVEDVEDRLFAVVDQLNRHRPRTNSKLTEEMADAIRAARTAGRSGKDLAAEYGVSPSVISAVWHGEIWNPNRPPRHAGHRDAPAAGRRPSTAACAPVRCCRFSCRT